MGDAIDGLHPVYIGDVDTPSSYWITPERCLNAHSTVHAVMELEKWLSHHCQSSPTALQSVVPGSYVAFLASPGCWVRGLVEHTVSTLEAPRASVFLLDWGHREPDASFSRLKPLPHKLREVPQLAWNLVLKDVCGPGEGNVLQVVKELVRRREGAALKNVEGKLSVDLYLHLPYDGDWKRHVPLSLIHLLETYDTEHVHLNRMLNDSNFLQLVKNTSSGLSIAGPSAPPKNKGTKLSKKSGSISQERGKLSSSISLEKGKLEDHAKSGKKKSKKRLTMRDYLADPANCNGSTKMSGVYGSFGNPNTSTPLNSSIDEIQGHLNMSGLGRADRLKIGSKFDAPKIGYNNNNEGEARLSDISPIDQYEYAEERGSNSVERSGKMSSSVIDSVAKVNHGQISLSDLSTTFGTGKGGVRLMPAGAEIVKQKKNKFHKNFPERGENCTQASHESNASFIRSSNSKNEEEARVSVVDTKLHSEEKNVEESCSFDNSWTPPRFGQYCERASDDDSVLWGDRSESDKREEAGAERMEAAQLKNCVLPEEKSVGGLAASGLARNVTPSSQLTDSRFVPDSASSPSLNPSPDMADKVAGKSQAQSILQSSSRAVKRIVFDLGVMEDEGNDSGDEYFSANESLEASEANISSGLDSASINQELNTAFDNDDKVSSTVSSVSSSVKDSPSGISGYKPSDETESPVGNEASISSGVDSTSIGQELNTAFDNDDRISSSVSPFPSSVKDSPSGIIRCEPSDANETESYAVNQDFSLPRDNQRIVEDSNVHKKCNLEILSVADPKSPCGFPRSPILINADKETIQVENEINEYDTPKQSKQSEIKEDDIPKQIKEKLIKFTKKPKEDSLNKEGERSTKYTGNIKVKSEIERSQIIQDLCTERRSLKENQLTTSTSMSASNKDDEILDQELSNEEGKEANLQNTDVLSLNQTLLHDYGKQSIHTLSGRKFEERFNSRDAWTKLLIHSAPKSEGGRKCKMVNDVTELGWPKELVSYLKQKKYGDSFYIQAALWPTISRLTSVVAIAAKKQGKTEGWALPLLSNLSDHENYRALPLGQGPKAVVLVSGWKSAADIANLLIDVSKKAFLHLTVVAAYAGAEDKLTASLINGVDVLVVTPACLLRLINERYSTNLDRCCHFVVEEADRVLEWFPKEVELLMNSWKKVGLKLNQTIVVGERWSESVKRFVKKYRTNFGLIVLRSLLEGVIYGDIPIKPHFFEDTFLKLSRLVEIVQSRGERRVCICCRDAEVGAQLGLHLLQAGIESLLIEEKCEPGEREDKLDNWNMDHTKPLILTDLAIMLNVVDPAPTDILIHWDYPKHSKLEFGIRFIMLKHAMKSFYGEENKDPANARIHILLTKEDTHMLKTIINLLKRNGTEIPLDLKNFYFIWKMKNAKQDVLSGEPLCSQLACRGVCRDNELKRCNHRHFLHNEMDQPKEVVSGVLEFLILFVESPVRYWVRILDPALDRKYQSLMFKIALYYNKKSNVIVLTEEDIEMGKTVVARCMDNVYKRARVVDMKYYYSRDKPRLYEIVIFLLDEGHTVEVGPGELVELAPEFALENFPPAAVAVVVTNLIPKDKDSDWSVSAGDLIHNKMNLQNSQLDDHEVKCKGTILLAMANTYWINECQLWVHQPNIGRWTLAFEFRKELLEKEHAVENPGHMEALSQLATRAGVQIPQLERFAFLPRDDSSQVYVSECFNPGLFYVTKVVDVKRVLDLERDMSSWAEEHVSSSLSCAPMVGDKVMAREGKGGSWFRGEIRQKLDGTQVGEDHFRVFKVDTGETVNVDLTDLAKIHHKFITRLPFQAIKCSLAFVKPRTRKSSSENVSCEEKTGQEYLDSAGLNVTQDSTGQNVTQDSTGQNVTQDSTGQDVPRNSAGKNLTQVETLVKKTNLSSSEKIMLKIFQKANKRKNPTQVATIVQGGDKMNEVEEETKNCWIKAAGDTLFDSTRDSEDDPEVLWCEVISVKGSGAHREYTVRLLTKKCKDIADTLVNDGLAKFTNNSDHLAQATYRDDQMKLQPQPGASQVQVDSTDEASDQSSPDSSESRAIFSQGLKAVSEEMSKLGFEMTPELVKELVESVPVEDSPSHESSVAPVPPLPLTAPIVAPAPPFPDPNAMTVALLPATTPVTVAPLTALSHVAVAPPLPLSVFVHPRDMPVAAPVPNLIPVETKKPALVWSQDQTSLKINVTFDTMRELQLEQIYIRVDPGILSLQVSEPLKHASGEEFVIHSTGPLQLHSLVHTRGSLLKVLGRRLMLTLKKCTACQWRQLTKQKMGWIKVDHDRQHSSDSDETNISSGFMGEFLKTGEGEKDEPKYDAVTGEQVLREADFEQQSDNEYDFDDQGDDLLDDAAVDYQPDGYEA